MAMKLFKWCLAVSMLAAVACGGDDGDAPRRLAAPHPVQNMAATTSYKVVVEWEAVGNAAGYSCVLDDSVPFYTESTTASFSALSPASDHTFKVMSVADNTGLYLNSEWSETIDVRTAAAE